MQEHFDGPNKDKGDGDDEPKKAKAAGKAAGKDGDKGGDKGGETSGDEGGDKGSSKQRASAWKRLRARVIHWWRGVRKWLRKLFDRLMGRSGSAKGST